MGVEIADIHDGAAACPLASALRALCWQVLSSIASMYVFRRAIFGSDSLSVQAG